MSCRTYDLQVGLIEPLAHVLLDGAAVLTKPAIHPAFPPKAPRLPPTMSKRPPKRSTPARPKLKQSRLAGINEVIKSIRRRPSVTMSDSCLKQSSLANFGFQKLEGEEAKEVEPEETPVRKKPRREEKRFLPDDEIAETQFALMTQSCYVDDDDDDHDMKKKEEGEEVGNGKGSVVMGVGMPPPPVTPKRKRVLEVPSSHSPPATPLTPFSQRKKAVDVDRLSPSPGPKRSSNLKKGLGSRGSATGARVAPFGKRAAPGVKIEMDIKVEDDEETASEEDEEPGAKVSEKSSEGDRNRVVKSSQWWEDEELTQRSSLGILVAGPQREHVIKSTLDEDDDSDHYEIRQEHEQAYISESLKPGDTGGQLPMEPLEEKADHQFLGESYETPELEDLPAARVGDVKEVEFNTTTTMIPINFRDDSPEESQEPDNIPLDQDFSPPPPSSTQDEEDEDEDAFHEFKPVRTQQLPSSFFHREDPSSPPSSDLPPSSQFLPEPLPSPPPDELGGSCDGDNGRDDAQNSPVTKEGGGSRGSGGVPLTVSQLLPSSLMETFPMPPPLSEYDSDEYEFGLESETQ